MVELGMIRDLVAIFGVVAGFTYYVLTVRNTQKNLEMSLKARQTQTFLQMYGAINPELIKNVSEVNRWKWADMEDFDAKYSDPEMFSKYESALVRYNGIGLLAKDNQLDLDLISKLLVIPITRLWEHYESVIQYRRKQYGYDGLYDGLEYLYTEMRNQYPELRLSLPDNR